MADPSLADVGPKDDIEELADRVLEGLKVTNDRRYAYCRDHRQFLLTLTRRMRDAGLHWLNELPPVQTPSQAKPTSTEPTSGNGNQFTIDSLTDVMVSWINSDRELLKVTHRSDVKMILSAFVTLIERGDKAKPEFKEQLQKEKSTSKKSAKSHPIKPSEDEMFRKMYEIVSTLVDLRGLLADADRKGIGKCKAVGQDEAGK